LTEILLVAVGVVILAVIGGVFSLSWTITWWSGIWLAGLGAFACIPTGIMYHLRLHKHLARLGRLQPNWYLSPVRLHAELDEEGRRRTMPWFFAGGASFFLFILGVFLIAAAMARAVYVDFG
jgi:hypothetical protein